MECTIWIPCGCLPYFKKDLHKSKITKKESTENYEYIPLDTKKNYKDILLNLDNKIERN